MFYDNKMNGQRYNTYADIEILFCGMKIGTRIYSEESEFIYFSPYLPLSPKGGIVENQCALSSPL